MAYTCGEEISRVPQVSVTELEFHRAEIEPLSADGAGPLVWTTRNATKLPLTGPLLTQK